MSSSTIRFPENARGNPDIEPREWVNQYLSSRPSQYAYHTFRDLSQFSEGIRERLSEIYPERYGPNIVDTSNFFDDPLQYIVQLVLRIFYKIYNTIVYYYNYEVIKFLSRAYEITTTRLIDFQWIKDSAKAEEQEYEETCVQEIEFNNSLPVLERTIFTSFDRYEDFCKRELDNREVLINIPPHKKACIEAFMACSLSTKQLVFILHMVILPGLVEFQLDDDRFLLTYAQKVEKQITRIGSNHWEEVPVLSWVVRGTEIKGSFIGGVIDHFSGLSFENRDQTNSWGSLLFGKHPPSVQRVQGFTFDKVRLDLDEVQGEQDGLRKVVEYNFLQFRDTLLYIAI